MEVFYSLENVAHDRARLLLRKADFWRRVRRAAALTLLAAFLDDGLELAALHEFHRDVDLGGGLVHLKAR